MSGVQVQSQSQLEMCSKGVFNGQMYVSEQLNRQLVNMVQELAQRCIEECGAKYGFNAEEAIRDLGLNMLKLERKAPMKHKMSKQAKSTSVKSAFPLPYNGEFNDQYCFALRQNNGLFTQCTGIRKETNSFCKSCASQMQKMGAETPEYGTIQMRNAVGIFEFTDPKGRKPTPYAKIMKKYKLTQEQVLAEAAKMNITIEPSHFTMPEETKRGRPKTEKQPKEKSTTKGRPKKAKKDLVIEGDDDSDTFFDALVKEANAETDELVLKSAEDKEAEKKAKEEKKAAEKAEKEAKLAAEKAEKEAKKAAEKAEKEAKLAAEKAEKEAKLAAEKAEKEAEKKAKEDKKAAEKAEKEAKKAEKEAKKSQKENKKETAAAAENDRCKKIEFEGKKYLKSKNTGIIYDFNSYIELEEQIVVGQWNEETKSIDFKKNDNNDDDSDVDSEYEM
jgi:hypothetical protein